MLLINISGKKKVSHSIYLIMNISYYWVVEKEKKGEFINFIFSRII